MLTSETGVETFTKCMTTMLIVQRMMTKLNSMAWLMLDKQHAKVK